MKIPMPDYVAINNPQAVMAILRDLNIPTPTSQKDLIIKTRQAVSKYKENVIHRLIAVHPDRVLFEHTEEKKETKSNCSGGCGCGGAATATHSNCAGCDENKSGADATVAPKLSTPVSTSVLALDKKTYVPVLVVIGASLIAFKLLLK